MNILLPIETINRELDFKLVLASYLSGKGHQIYIGQHDFLMTLAPKMKEGGLYIGKNLFNLDASEDKGEKYYFLKKHNFNIIYLNEEGAIFFKGEEEMTKRLKSLYNIDFFDENDDVCVWGSLQKRIEDKRASNVSIHATGHPRFDLCKKEWHSLYHSKVKTLLETYNNFILINGNYVAANHGLGNEYLFLDKTRYSDAEKRLNFINVYNYTSKQLTSMIHLTHHLAVLFPKLNFIYRPHPSEDHNYYELVFSGVKNIHVKHDGPVLPWILASKLLLHDGCTTAIEASLAEKPVINYKPILDDHYDIWLPNQMGTRMTTIDEVVFYIKEMNRNNFNFPSQRINEKVLEYLYSFNGNSYEAFLKIIEQRIDKDKINSSVPTLNIKKNFLKISIRDFLIKIFQPYKRKHLIYHNTKFYGFSKKDVNQKFENISKLLKKKIIYKFHNSHLISIQ